jgi:hypothetical protein
MSYFFLTIVVLLDVFGFFSFLTKRRIIIFFNFFKSNVQKRRRWGDMPIGMDMVAYKCPLSPFQMHCKSMTQCNGHLTFHLVLVF